MKTRFLVRGESKSAVLRINGVIDQYFDGESFSVSDTEKDLLNELGTIPNDKPIDLHVNCPGGSVMLALGIHNALKSVAGRLTVHNAGYMLSSATLLAPPGAKVVSPKSSVWMFHRPAMTADGNEDDLSSAIDCLKANTRTMASIYSERSGKSMKACMDLMSANNGTGTWMSGDEAVKEGFADDDADDGDMDMTARIDPRVYAQLKIPDRFKDRILAASADSNDLASAPAPKISATAPKGGERNGGQSATPKKEQNMIKIITALVAAGFKLPADANEDQVSAVVSELVTARASLSTENTDLKAKADQALKEKVESHVQSKVDAKIIGSDLKEKWVSAILTNPMQQELLDAMKPAAIAPQTPPRRGAAPPPAEKEGDGKTNDEKLADLRAEMNSEKDPTKKAQLARQARELRGHGGLFNTDTTPKHVLIDGRAYPISG